MAQEKGEKEKENSLTIRSFGKKKEKKKERKKTIFLRWVILATENINKNFFSLQTSADCFLQKLCCGPLWLCCSLSLFHKAALIISHSYICICTRGNSCFLQGFCVLIHIPTVVALFWSTLLPCGKAEEYMGNIEIGLLLNIYKVQQ